MLWVQRGYRTHDADRKGQVMASIQERPNQNKPWSVRWREGSKNRRKSFRLKSEAKQYLAEAEAIEGKQRSGTWRAPPDALDRTVEQQAGQWMRARSHLSASTRATDRSTYNAWITPAVGDVKLSAVRKHHLENILSDMVEAGRSSASRKDVYGRFCQMMDHALGKGGHDLRAVHMGSVKRQRKIKPLTDDEWARLLAQVPDEWRLYVDVMGTLGLRPQECAALTGVQFSFGPDGNTVTIDRAVKSDGEVGGTKTGTLRTLVVPDHLVGPLSEAVADQTGETLWPWEGYPNLDNWRKRVWNPACEEAGMPERVPYDLRHTCASKLIALGATVIDVAEWMGHSKQMTMNTYGHLFPGRKAELASMLNRKQSADNVVSLRAS